MKWVTKHPAFGDMIRIDLGGLYHMGIYVSDDEVIQFGLPPTSENLLSANSIRVTSSDIDTFSAGKVPEVCTFDAAETKKIRTPEEIVSYARSKLGTGGYHILYNNCEHFANECVTGISISHQAEDVRAMFRKMPVVHLYISPLPVCDIGEKLICSERWDEICSVKNDKVRREKYYVWRLLEYALEHTFGAKAKDLRFGRDNSGRWFCDRYEFSLSHSEGMLCVAVSRTPVGVDIEKLRAPRSDRMAEMILTPSETEVYQSLAKADKERYLIEKWCAKESIFKFIHKDNFTPSQIETSDFPVKSGEIMHCGNTYLWAVATDTPDVIKVYDNIILHR